MSRIFLVNILFLIAFQGMAVDVNVKDLGAGGKKDELITPIIQKAIDSCFSAGGGRVYFPPGNYLSGTIQLKTNVSLYLMTGATLWASRNEKDYPDHFVIYKKNDSGKEGDGRTPVLVYAKNAKNIGIEGKGIINGQAQRTYEDLKKVDGFIADETENARKSGVEMKMYYKVKPYTCMVFFESSEHIHISQTSFIESTDWTLHFKWCKKIFVDNVYIESSLEKGVNADGIDIDGCTDAVITNSIIETGDDAIVLKSTNTFDKFQPCQNVTVSNCVLVSTSTALKLGTESFGDFRYINFNNCVIRNTNRGLSIVVRDGATVSNVIFSDITMECNRKHFNWWGNADPFWLVVKKRHQDSKIGKIENVVFRNIIAHVQGTAKLEGFPGHPLQNIRMNQVQIFMYPESKPDKRADNAFFASEVNQLSISDMEITWDTENPEPKWSNAIALNKVNNVMIKAVKAKQAPGNTGAACMSLQNVKNTIISDCIAKPGTSVFIKADGRETENIVLSRNYLPDKTNKIEKGEQLKPDAIELKTEN